MSMAPPLTERSLLIYEMAQRPEGVSVTELMAVRPDLFWDGIVHHRLHSLVATGWLERRSCKPVLVHGGALRYRYFADPLVTVEQRHASIDARMREEASARRSPLRKGIDALLAKTPGMTAVQMRDILGMEGVPDRLQTMRTSGAAFSRGKNPTYWFLTQAEADAFVMPERAKAKRKKRDRVVGLRPLKEQTIGNGWRRPLIQDARPAIYHAGTKITQCPSCPVDTRFQVRPGDTVPSIWGGMRQLTYPDAAESGAARALT